MKKSKVLLTLLCAVALVATSVFGTLAYLQSTDEVVNTFTVGKVVIALDEAEVDEDGVVISEERVKENAYKLMPGHEYTKDPIVYVDADSESCYVFVKVVNGIVAIEDASNTIAAQIAANEWIPLEGVANVFYQEYEKNQEDKKLEVFESFKVAGSVTNDGIEDYLDSEITINAYAIQVDGFEGDVNAAWAVFAQ